MRTLSCIALLLCVTPAVAQRVRELPRPTAEVRAYTLTTETDRTAIVEIFGAEGPAFLALGTIGPFNLYTAFPLGVGTIDAEGYGRLERSVPLGPLPPGVDLEVCLAYGIGGPLNLTPPETLQVSPPPWAETLDFDYTMGMTEPRRGEEIYDQWASAGVLMEARNNVPTHPDKAIIFDGADPSGGDYDLVTPEGHKLLIIAENDDDLNTDGFVDDPDDEMFGGELKFYFDAPVTVYSATLVDVDEYDTAYLRFLHTDGMTSILPFASLGDGSVQTLTFLKTFVTTMDVVMTGSGGLLSIEMQPCPYVVDFEERSLGFPMAMRAGEEITGQFEDIGLTVHALNATPFHPDMAILLDSANPTGDDTDLETPGPGIGNDEPLGKVLVIAENAIDANFDGYVDDPDDEAAGGVMVFALDNNAFFYRATLIDIDEGEVSYFEFYDELGQLITTLPIPDLGDNSVQVVEAEPAIGGVRTILLHLGGSGAITRLNLCPDRGRIAM